MDNKKDLLTMIALSQAGDEQVTLQIIEMFMPLLRKYARGVSYYGAADHICDFRVDLLALLRHMNTSDFQTDYQVIAYIRKSIYNAYLKYAQKTGLTV